MGGTGGKRESLLSFIYQSNKTFYFLYTHKLNKYYLLKMQREKTEVYIHWFIHKIPTTD